MKLPHDLEDRATANAFMSMGWAYLCCAEIVLQRLEKMPSYAGSVADHLVGHSLELIFKAQLRHVGITASDLAIKPDYKHGLIKLFEKAKSSGLGVNASEDDKKQLGLLDRQFGRQPFVTRYPYTGNDEAIDALTLLRFARRAIDDLQPRLQPERVKNKGLLTRETPPPQCTAAAQGLTLEQATEEIGKLLEKETTP